MYNDVQEQQECCSCPLTANSLLTFSVINNLTSNPFNPKESLSAGVIKIFGTKPADPVHCSNTVGAVTAGVGLVSALVAGGLHEWINHNEMMFSPQGSPPLTKPARRSRSSHLPLSTLVKVAIFLPDAQPSTQPTNSEAKP